LKIGGTSQNRLIAEMVKEKQYGWSKGGRRRSLTSPARIFAPMNGKESK
jgi:hypothetical protein